jgi:hypothetical protein
MLSFYTEAQDALKAKLQVHIAGGSRLSLTTDTWTVSNSDSYIGITVHWIDSNWQTYRWLLDFVQLPPSHTGKACFEALAVCCKRFGILDYIMGITSDSHVANDGMVECFEKLAFKRAENDFITEAPLAVFKVADGHIRCMAHSINLSVQDILSSLKISAEKNTSVLYDNTRFTSTATYGSAVGNE